MKWWNITWAARPLLRLAATLLGVSLFTFVLLELVPGDAADLLLSQQQTASAESLAALRQELGLDASLPLRSIRWLGRAAMLDFGTSFRSGEPVSKEILRCLPTTLTLACCTLLFVVCVSVAGGIVSALFQNRILDTCHRLWTVLTVSIPDYWMGLMLLLIFALTLRWLPVFSGSSWKAYILPVLALGLSVAAAEGRVFRASILEAMSQDHVLFARAKGLPPGKIFLRHVLRTAVLPMISVWGMLLGHLLGGTVVIESVFSLPGLGKLAADAVLQRDMPMIQGAVLTMTFFFAISSSIMETIHTALLPRKGYEEHLATG
jgi:nickel transport system permease protein